MRKSVYIAIIIACIPVIASAQQADTLTLRETISRVINTYPTVKQADEAMKSAGYQVKMARAALLPVLNASASYMRVEPVAKVHFEDMDLSFDPNNNYQAGISLTQLLYDFGKNRPKIEAAKQKEELARIQKEELYQNLALNTVQMYYLNSFTREAIRIKRQQLSDYDEMLRQAEVRAKSGSATSFDLLNTQVGQSGVKTQLTELLATLNIQQRQLSILADTVVSESVPLSTHFELQPNLTGLDNLLATAYANRPEVQMANKQIAIARLEESAARRAYNPSLDLSASAGGKNGYPTHIDRMKLNYTAGVKLSIPLYEGGRRKQTVSLAQSASTNAVYQKELIEKQVHQQVSDTYYTLESDYSKMLQLQQQVKLARQAYQQAKVNYAAGTITNLELLTSSTSLADSELQLLQSRINYQIESHKLQVSIGAPIW